MKEYKAPSGAKVVINPSSWKNSIALKNAIAKELAKSDIDLDGKDIMSFKDKDFINAVVEPILLIDSSEEVYNRIFDCLGHCTYNGEKINEYIFDDEEARGDYYSIIFECIKANLAPFFKGLLSQLSTIKLTDIKSQKQK